MKTFIIIALFGVATMGIWQQPAVENPLVVTGAKVIFFAPMKAEVDSIVANEGLEITDVLDDYDFATGKVAYYLTSLKIPCAFTDRQVILFKLSHNRVRRFDRRLIADPMGMILTDGEQEPRLIAGPREEPQLISEINTFFHIE